MYKLNVLVAGSTGYIGIQLIKLLSNHKCVFIKYLCGNTSIGKKISYFDKSLERSKNNLKKILSRLIEKERITEKRENEMTNEKHNKVLKVFKVIIILFFCLKRCGYIL